MLRARRDAVEDAGGAWDPVEGVERRASFRRLAAAFPGALRELERPAARLAALADEVAAEAAAGGVARPWVHLSAAYHELLAEALAAKLWLARRVGPRGAIDDATLAAGAAELGRALARDEAEALHHPPRGRVVELVWRELAARSGLPRAVVRALVLEHGAGVTRHDWRWQLRLPGDRMLLVPVDDAGAQRLRRERRLLAALAPRVSFAVPRPLGALDGPDDVRQRVPGATGMQFHWSTLEDPALALAYADDLARILAELHTAFDDDELAALGLSVAPDAYPLPAPRLRAVVASLPPEIHARLHAALDRYAEQVPDAPDPVLVHGDVGTHNIAFDPVTRRVVGIFDFEGAARLDRHHDFKYLPSYGPRVMARVLEEYQRRTGVAVSLPRVRLTHLATALSYWVWREADPDAHDRLSGRDRDQALAWIGHALFALDR